MNPADPVQREMVEMAAGIINDAALKVRQSAGTVAAIVWLEGALVGLQSSLISLVGAEAAAEMLRLRANDCAQIEADVRLTMAVAAEAVSKAKGGG